MRRVLAMVIYWICKLESIHAYGSNWSIRPVPAVRWSGLAWSLPEPADHRHRAAVVTFQPQHAAVGAGQPAIDACFGEKFTTLVLLTVPM